MEAGPPLRRRDPGFVERLVEICGAGHVVTDATTLATYRSDALTRRARAPTLAVLPGTAGEVAAVVTACAAANAPWVARGAGTGLSGGALPEEDGVLIVLSRLRRILSVDLEDQRVVVEPGVTNLAVSRAVAPTHFYPPDPASRAVCTLGGNVAENASGPRSLKYGVTTDHVLGLDVVLADGSLVELRRDRPGYDLVGAFVGSEGTLGIAVAIHLRVLPVPESVRTVVAYFETSARAADAAGRVSAAGLAPAAMELIDALGMRAGGQGADVGHRRDAGAALILEFAGPREESVTELEAVMAICGRRGALDLRVALDAAERERLWESHRRTYVAMRQVASAYAVADGVVPRPRLGEVLERIAVLSSEFGLAVAGVAGAGAGNLHPIVCYDEDSPAEAARARELTDRIMHACLEAGGSISGEHGIGADKLDQMRAMFSAADLAAFEALRRAFDPRRLANPGKLLPTRG